MPNEIVGGQGIYLSYNAASYMNIIRCIFNHSGRQAEHYVLSFTDEEASRLNKHKALELGYAICDFFKGVQVLFAYHECNALDFNHQLHVHFAVGTTNLNTGKKYHTDPDKADELGKHTERILYDMNISNQRLSVIYR